MRRDANNKNLRDVAKICLSFLPLLVIILFFIVPIVGEINATKSTFPAFGAQTVAYIFWIVLFFFVSFLLLVTSYFSDIKKAKTTILLIISIFSVTLGAIYTFVVTITVYIPTFNSPDIFSGNAANSVGLAFIATILIFGSIRVLTHLLKNK